MEQQTMVQKLKNLLDNITKEEFDEMWNDLPDLGGPTVEEFLEDLERQRKILEENEKCLK